MSNLCGNTFINVRLLHRTPSQVNFLLLLQSTSTSWGPLSSFILFSVSFCRKFIPAKNKIEFLESEKGKTKSSIYYSVSFDPGEYVSNYTQTSTLLLLCPSLQTLYYSLLRHSIPFTFSTPHSVLLQFDSVWINCSSYGRRHTISLNPDNGVWLGRGEYTANLLTAHLPNDWCLHATSPEECLSQRHFLHLNNTQDPKADVKDAHKHISGYCSILLLHMTC